jgi:hypothetical protein
MDSKLLQLIALSQTTEVDTTQTVYQLKVKGIPCGLFNEIGDAENAAEDAGFDCRDYQIVVFSEPDVKAC